MGYRMAKNLRKKLHAESTIIICDVVKPLIEKFTSEVKEGIEVAETPKEVAEKCVSMHVKYGSSSPLKH